MNLNWRLIITGPMNAAANMAMDEAILREIENAEDAPNVLRLYQWEKPSISLGNSQKAEKEFNLSKVEEDQFDIVRRFTGGRAVLHWDELTYSVIGPIRSEHWSSRLSDTYQIISEALLLALQNIGFQGELSRRDLDETKLKKQNIAKPCFSSTARSEVIWNAKKIIGSAQRRTKKAFVQHGSMLLNEKHSKIVDYMNLSPEEKRLYLIELEKNAVSLQTILGNVDIHQLSHEMVNAFSRVFNTTLEESELNESEELRYKDLLIKYSSI